MNDKSEYSSSYSFIHAFCNLNHLDEYYNVIMSNQKLLSFVIPAAFNGKLTAKPSGKF